MDRRDRGEAEIAGDRVAGGVAELERSPQDPRAEMWIAAAGPAVNLAIAAALSLFGFATGILANGGLIGAVFTGLVWANLMLALFNLVPAFPMDGGRVFRAWATRRYGRVRATELATRLGRALAVGFGIWGVIGSNPVLVLVAAFVWFAAGRELAGLSDDAMSAIRGPARCSPWLDRVARSPARARS